MSSSTQLIVQLELLLIIKAENSVCVIMLQLLEDEQFTAVDKIKTTGNVYMFAVGLKPQCIIDVSFNLI